MCMLCDGYSEEEVRRTTELHIITHGWSVSGVESAPHDRSYVAPWAYTIGLTESYGHPELVVVGIELEAAGGLLNAARGADRRRLEPR